MHLDFKFMDLLKTILNFAIEFVKEYNKKSVVTRIVYIMKDVVQSDFLTEKSPQAFYQYMQVARMLLGHGSVLALMESLTGNDAGSKRLGISHLSVL